MIFTLTKNTPQGHDGCLKCYGGDSRCGKFWGKSAHHVVDYFKTAAKVLGRRLLLDIELFLFLPKLLFYRIGLGTFEPFCGP